MRQPIHCLEKPTPKLPHRAEVSTNLRALAVPLPWGETLEYLELVRGKKLTHNDPFDGINTRWTRVKGGAPIGEAIEKIIEDFDFSALVCPDCADVTGCFIAAS